MKVRYQVDKLKRKLAEVGQQLARRIEFAGVLNGAFGPYMHKCVELENVDRQRGAQHREQRVVYASAGRDP